MEDNFKEHLMLLKQVFTFVVLSNDGLTVELQSKVLQRKIKYLDVQIAQGGSQLTQRN